MPKYGKPLESYYIPEPNSGCWLWLGAATAGGYGNYWYEGRCRRAHSVLYILNKGPIPDGLILDHLCRNPACVNPDHLEAVTNRKNIMRGNASGARATRTGYCCHGHRLTGENVRHRPDGKRACRTCERMHDSDRAAKRKILREAAL